MTETQLPKSDSPDIHLVVATPEENLAQTNANSEEWRGALSLEAYLRREEYLLGQDLTRNGGLTAWMLVYQPADGSKRHVLCGCETIRKKALVSKEGNVEDVVAHGVCSVFCPPKHRGRGYAGRMMTEVGKRLKKWQAAEGQDSTAFSVLYSDIGKEFYAARGWQPFPSAHISLPAMGSEDKVVRSVKTLQSEDLSEFCTIDEKLLRNQLSQRQRTAVALVPDARTLQWHHAREEFVSKEVNNGTRPEFMEGGKGAIVEVSPGSRVWCYWTRVWTNPNEDAPNTLHILRLVIEDEVYSDFSPASEDGVAKLKGSPVVKAVSELLAMAQMQAHRSGMQEVWMWNPTSTALAAAQLLDEKAAVVHREKESVASLQWYGDGSWEDLDWVCNEKYGWC